MPDVEGWRVCSRYLGGCSTHIRAHSALEALLARALVSTTLQPPRPERVATCVQVLDGQTVGAGERRRAAEQRRECAEPLACGRLQVSNPSRAAASRYRCRANVPHIRQSRVKTVTTCLHTVTTVTSFFTLYTA